MLSEERTKVLDFAEQLNLRTKPLRGRVGTLGDAGLPTCLGEPPTTKVSATHPTPCSNPKPGFIIDQLQMRLSSWKRQASSGSRRAKAVFASRSWNGKARQSHRARLPHEPHSSPSC